MYCDGPEMSCRERSRLWCLDADELFQQPNGTIPSAVHGAWSILEAEAGHSSMLSARMSGTAQSKPRHPNSVKERHCHQLFFLLCCWQSWQQLACWDFSGKADISKCAVNDMCVAMSMCHRFKIPSCPLVTFMRWGGQNFPYHFLSSCAAFKEKRSEHRSPQFFVCFFFKLAIFIHVS